MHNAFYSLYTIYGIIPSVHRLGENTSLPNPHPHITQTHQNQPNILYSDIQIYSVIVVYVYILNHSSYYNYIA